MARWTMNEADRASARKTAKGRSALTPMIDVTFLLLLFFLMTFTFREAEGQIPGSLPQCVPPGPSTPIEIVVRPAGPQRQGVVFEIPDAMYQTSSPRELGDRLMAIKRQGNDEANVTIRARGDVQWRWAVEAFNQAVRAKCQFIGWSAGE